MKKNTEPISKNDPNHLFNLNIISNFNYYAIILNNFSKKVRN